MVADAKRLGFPFLAGSSLPVTWRLPAIDVPHGAPLTRACASATAASTATIFTASKRRSACPSAARAARSASVGACGARAEVWEMSSNRPRNPAPVRRGTVPQPHSAGQGTGSDRRRHVEWARKAFTETIAYFIEHRDGFRTTLFLLAIQDFNYAGLRGDNGEIISCQMYLPDAGRAVRPPPISSIRWCITSNA